MITYKYTTLTYLQMECVKIIRKTRKLSEKPFISRRNRQKKGGIIMTTRENNKILLRTMEIILNYC